MVLTRQRLEMLICWCWRVWMWVVLEALAF